jgi:hypothetical protein
MKRLTATFAALLLLATAGALASTSYGSVRLGGGCEEGYAYAGMTARSAGAGISANVTSLRAPLVAAGHVAAWVGVGGEGLGPNGESEWIQVGVSAVAGGVSNLYYEVAQPGSKPTYHGLRRAKPGVTYRVAVVEVSGRPGIWRVWVNGSPVSKPFFLPKSHGNWTPIATAESWDGGVRTCNSFSYKFTDVRMLRADARWTNVDARSWLVDRGYRVVQQRAGAFVATRA